MAPYCHACEFKIDNYITSVPRLDSPKFLGKFSGALYFPQFRLVVLSPTEGIVDILSMGSYKPKEKDMAKNSELYRVKGALHCVFSNRFVHQLHEANVTAIPIDEHMKSSIVSISIPMLDGTKKTFRCMIYNIGNAVCVDENRKGENEFPINEIKDCVVYGDNLDKTVDISMIIGKHKDSKEYMLLNMRFHQPIPDTSHDAQSFFRLCFSGLTDLPKPTTSGKRNSRARRKAAKRMQKSKCDQQGNSQHIESHMSPNKTMSRRKRKRIQENRIKFKINVGKKFREVCHTFVYN